MKTLFRNGGASILFLSTLMSGCAGLQKAAPPPAPKPEPPPRAQYIVPPGMEFVSSLFGYSQAVRVGPWVTVSAVPGFDIEKRGFPEAFEDQLAAAFRNLDTVLKISGVERHQVVEMTTWQLDMGKFNETIDARNEFFDEHRPAWSAVGVTALPMPSMQFQISVRAFSPGGKVFPPAIRDSIGPSAPGHTEPNNAVGQSTNEPAPPQEAPIATELAEPETDAERKGVNKRFRSRPGQW